MQDTLKITQRNQSESLQKYNVWLLDPNREVGKPYPGNFFSNAKEQKMNLGEAISNMTRVSTIKQPKAVKKIRAPKAGSKQEKANQIVQQAFAGLNGTIDKSFKSSMIVKIMEEVGMSKAGATTYLYNALKTVG